MAAPHAGSAPANPADTAASSAAPAATTAALPQQKAPKKDKAAKDGTQSYPLEMTPPPDFLQQRIDMFNRIKHAHDERMKQMPREEITITLKDGSVKKATSWDDSPLSLAQGISKSLAERTVIAKVGSQPLSTLEQALSRVVRRSMASSGILSVLSRRTASLSCSTLRTTKVSLHSQCSRTCR